MYSFSIIVPVYQAEQYLRRCLESILSQSLRNFEVILVDDGSVDNSGKICDEYAEHYEFIRTIHKKNAGAASARNIGLDYAAKDYIVFVDADDYVSSDYLENLNACLEQYQDVCVLCKIIGVVDKEEQLLERWGEQYAEVIRTKSDYLRNYYGGPKGTCEVVWKRELLERTGSRFDEEFKVCEDTKLIQELFFECESFAYLLKPCYYYKLDTQDSLTKKYKQNVVIRTLEIEYMYYKKMQEIGDDVLNKSNVDLWIKKQNRKLLLDVPKTIKAKEDLKSVWKKIEGNKDMYLSTNSLIWRLIFHMYVLFGYENIVKLVPRVAYETVVKLFPGIRRMVVCIHNKKYKIFDVL